MPINPALPPLPPATPAVVWVKPLPPLPKQQAAVLAVRVLRGPVGAVADQRAAEQCLGGRVDRVEHHLLDGVALGGRIQVAAGGQGLHELVVKDRRLGAERLIGLGVLAKQRRDGQRHLVGAGRGNLDRRGRGRRGRGADRRPDAGQIGRRRCQHLGVRDHKRHGCSPFNGSKGIADHGITSGVSPQGPGGPKAAATNY